MRKNIILMLIMVSIPCLGYSQDKIDNNKMECSSSPFIEDGEEFYHKCYCEKLTYPNAEKFANSLGLTLKSTSVANLIDNPDYSKCGVELIWANKPETKEDCESRIQKFLHEVSLNINASEAGLECN